MGFFLVKAVTVPFCLPTSQGHRPVLLCTAPGGGPSLISGSVPSGSLPGQEWEQYSVVRLNLK